VHHNSALLLPTVSVLTLCPLRSLWLSTEQEMQDELLNFDVQAVHAATSQQLTPKQSPTAK
jgi:hypothetical protein